MELDKYTCDEIVNGSGLTILLKTYDIKDVISKVEQVFKDIDNEKLSTQKILKNLDKWNIKYELFEKIINFLIKKDEENYSKRVIGSILHFLKSGIRSHTISTDINFVDNYELILNMKNEYKNNIDFSDDGVYYFDEENFLYRLAKIKSEIFEGKNLNERINAWLIYELNHFILDFDRENDKYPLSSILLAPYFIQYQMEFYDDNEDSSELYDNAYLYEFEKDFKDLDNFYFKNCLFIIRELMDRINFRKYVTKQDIIDSLPYFNWFLTELENKNNFFKDEDIIKIANKYTRFPIYKEPPYFYTLRRDFKLELRSYLKGKEANPNNTQEQKQKIKEDFNNIEAKAKKLTLNYIQKMKKNGEIQNYPLIFQHPFDSYDYKFEEYIP